jgi:hypothetical protein
MRTNILFFLIQTQARHWTLTIYDDAEVDKFIKHTETSFVSFSYQQEVCPKTGKVHLQAYCGYEKPVRFNQLKAIWPTAHIEMARMHTKAFEYCQKPESRLEGGLSGCSEPPKKGGIGGEWDRLVARIKEGATYDQLFDEFPKLVATCDSGVRKHYERFNPKFGTKCIERVVILYGPPGTGKSSTVIKAIGDRPYHQLMHGKWFDGYNYEEILWIDDLQPNTISRAALLQLMEHGSLRMEIKGGTTMTYFKEIYITSNWDPNEWFPEKDEERMRTRAQAVIRRAKVMRVDSEECVTVTASLGNTSLDLLEKKQQSILGWMTKDRERDRD